jgi:hypothetical protein
VVFVLLQVEVWRWRAGAADGEEEVGEEPNGKIEKKRIESKKKWLKKWKIKKEKEEMVWDECESKGCAVFLAKSTDSFEEE